MSRLITRPRTPVEAWISSSRGTGAINAGQPPGAIKRSSAWYSRHCEFLLLLGANQPNGIANYGNRQIAGVDIKTVEKNHVLFDGGDNLGHVDLGDLNITTKRYTFVFTGVLSTDNSDYRYDQADRMVINIGTNIEVYDGSWNSLGSPAAYQDDRMHTCVFVFDESRCSLYIDGYFYSTTSFTTKNLGSTAKFWHRYSPSPPNYVAVGAQQLGALYSTNISDREAIEISYNPWILFESASTRPFVYSSGPAGFFARRYYDQFLGGRG